MTSSIFQDGGLSVANLSPVFGIVTSRIEDGQRLFAYQTSTRYNLNPRPSNFRFENKRKPFWSNFASSSNAGAFRRHSHVILQSASGYHFFRTKQLATELWRHIDLPVPGWQPLRRKSIYGFRLGDVSHLRRPKNIRMLNFDKISQSKAEIVLLISYILCEFIVCLLHDRT